MLTFMRGASYGYGIAHLYQWYRAKHPRKPNKFEWDEFMRMPTRYRRNPQLCQEHQSS